MTAIGWQDLAVFVLVGGALAWLLWRRFARRNRAAGCEHCPANPAASGTVTDFMPTGRPRRRTSAKTPPTR